MKFVLAVLTVSLGVVAAQDSADPTTTAAVAVHPIVNVINTLEEKKTQINTEAGDEQAVYDSFATWCSESETSLNTAIENGKETVETERAEVNTLTEEIATLEREIAKLAEDIEGVDKRETTASTLRGEENAAYTESFNQLTTTIEVLNETIDKFMTVKTERDHASLLQTAKTILVSFNEHLNDNQRQQLTTLFQKQPVNQDMMSDSSKFTTKYAFKSNQVVALLTNMKTKFESDKAELVSTETTAESDFQTASSARGDQKTEYEGSKSTKEGRKAAAEGELNQAQADLESAKSDLVADVNTLTDTKKQCAVKAAQWAERSKTRANELKAMDAAITILEKVTGVRVEPPENEALPTLPNATNTTVLTQVNFLQVDSRSSSKPSSPVLARVVSMLKSKTSVVHSKSLTWLIRQMTPLQDRGPNFFQEIIDVIFKMIWKLEDEQKADTDHKAWCDVELSKTKIILDEKLDKKKETELLLESLRNTLQLTMQEITTAQEEIAAYDATIFQAGEIRGEGKRQNELAIKDAQEAQKQLADAIKLLIKFYKDSGGIAKQAWESFAQRDPVQLPANPDTWTTSYVGASDPEGAIAVLEACQGQFSQMEADTKANEATDANQYDQLLKDAEVEKTRRNTDIDQKNEKKKRLMDKLDDKSNYYTDVKKEVRAAERYATDLGTSCEALDYFSNETATSNATMLNISSTYELRIMSRLQEIEALKQAQAILYNATVNISMVTPPPLASTTLPFVNITHVKVATMLEKGSCEAAELFTPLTKADCERVAKDLRLYDNTAESNEWNDGNCSEYPVPKCSYTPNGDLMFNPNCDGNATDNAAALCAPQAPICQARVVIPMTAGDTVSDACKLTLRDALEKDMVNGTHMVMDQICACFLELPEESIKHNECKPHPDSPGTLMDMFKICEAGPPYAFTLLQSKASHPVARLHEQRPLEKQDAVTSNSAKLAPLHVRAGAVHSRI